VGVFNCLGVSGEKVSFYIVVGLLVRWLMSGLALSARDLVKVYRDGVRALDGVTVDVPSGCVFSLLGRNGAGKTTFVKIASTQLLPSSGYLEVLGFDVVREAGEIRRRIAVVPQEGRPAYLNTPYEHVFHYLLARGYSISEARRRTWEVLRELELEEYAHKTCSQLSGGLRQRTLVAMAMAPEAELLFLDEPTIGLDAVTRIKLWQTIRSIARERGQTIVLTTHYMEEAEALSDVVAIIESGRLVKVGEVEEIKRSLGYSVCVEMTFDGLDVEALREYGYVIALGSDVRVFTDEKNGRELLNWALANGKRATLRSVNLEDVFIAHVGRRIEEDEQSSEASAW